MKLKLDENGHVVVVEGKPVYVHDDGNEIPFDALGTTRKVGELVAARNKQKTENEALVTELKGFEGLDAAASRDALDKLSKLDQKKLIDAGEVDKVRNEVSKVYEERLTAESKLRIAAETNLTNKTLDWSFAQSKYIADKIESPPDLIRSYFGSNFSVKDGKFVAKDASGNEIYSKARVGELANFDEALEILVENYPHKDRILKGSGASGSGSQGGKPSAGAKQMTRSDFDAQSPQEQRAFVTGGGKIDD